MERLSPELQDLVEAERAESDPSAEDLERTRKALLGRIAAVGAAGAVAGTAAKAAASASLAPVASPVSIGFWLKVAVSVVVVAGTAALVVPRFTRPPAPVEKAALVVPAKPEAVAPPAPEPSAPPSAPESAVKRAQKNSNPKPIPSGRAVPPLAQEVKLLKDAQRALKAGQPGTALAALAEHEKRFPRGQLALERSAARIAALCAAGRTEEAKRRGGAFLSRHGGSALAEQVRASCAGDKVPGR